MAGICYQWTLFFEDLHKYRVLYKPVGATYTNVAMSALPLTLVGEDSCTVFVCSEMYPQFQDANVPGSSDYLDDYYFTVAEGGSCTNNQMCDPYGPVETEFSLTLQVSPPGYGTAVDLTDEGPYEKDDIVSVSASPESDKLFVRWTVFGEEVSTLQGFDFTMPAGDTVLVAHFKDAPVDPPEPPPAPPVVPDSYMALEIRVDGHGIPIERITRKNSTGIFTDDLVGDYSFPITIPLDKRLMTALKLPDDPQTSYDFSKPFPAELWKQGNRLYKGTLEILEATDDSVEAVFALSSGFFVSSFAETKLPECYDPDDIISINPPTLVIDIFKIYASGLARLDSVRININGLQKTFLRSDYEIEGEVTTGQAEEYYNQVQEKLMEFYEDAIAWIEGLGIPLKVSLKFSEEERGGGAYIHVEETSAQLSVSISGQSSRGRGDTDNINNRQVRVDTYEDIRYDMAEYNDYDPAKRIAFPTILNKTLYEGNNAVFDDIVNRYDQFGYLHVTNSPFVTFDEAVNWENAVIPFVYLTEVVRKVFEKAGITPSGEFFDHDMVQRMLLYNNRTLDFVAAYSVTTGSNSRRGTNQLANDDIDNPAFHYRNDMDFNIRVGNHVPHVTTTDFLKALKNFFGLKFDFNPLQNRVEIRFIRSIIRGREIVDMTRQASRVYTIKHAQETAMAFQYDSPDNLFADGLKHEPPAVVHYTVQKYAGMLALDPELEEYCYVHSLAAYFRFEKAKEEAPAWQLYAFRMRPDATEGQKIRWPLTMYPMMDAHVDAKKMPAIEMTVNNPEAGIENEDIGLRLMCFYGRQNDSLSRPYAFASANKYNGAENQEPGQYDLDIRQADMAYWWEDLETIRGRARIYETVLKLSDSDLVKMSRTSLIRIDNILYLIDEIEESISPDEYSLAKVKMYKVKTKKT